jgi:Protein of unknown function (DUF2817)
MLASTYALSRQDFLAAARAANATLDHYVHPLKGKDAEELALDVAVIGTSDSPKRLLISSGCHGVEGFAGSGIQAAALNDKALLAKAQAAGVTLVFAHALNPFGFSHVRRVTHENVDLNRNFLAFDQALPINNEYSNVHALLFPAQWPPDANNQANLGKLIAEKGMPYLQAAVAGGQYTHADGIFYGGTAPTWSNLATRAMLKQHCAGSAQLGWIDLHTGLGPAGHGERIFSPSFAPVHADQREAYYARANAWWGGNGSTRLTRVDDGTSSSQISGSITAAGLQECPRTQITKITLEFGTVPGLEVLQALRAEQWLERNPQAPAAQAQAIKTHFFAAFFIQTQEWQSQVVAQGLETIYQAVDGLTAA